MEKITFNDTVIKILIPVIAGAIGFFITDLLRQTNYKIERQKYAADVLKNVYSSKNAHQGLSYLNFIKSAISESSSFFSIEDDSLVIKLERTIINNYSQLYQTAKSRKDTLLTSEIELAITQYDSSKLNEIVKGTELEGFTTIIKSKKDLALELEKQMYEALNGNDYQLSIQKAEELDKFFPQFHSAYEVGKTLKTAQKASDNSPNKRDSIMREAKEKVKSGYNYGYKIN